MTIVFDTIPASIRKPGKYAEFNTGLAQRTLPSNANNVVFFAPMAATGGSALPYTPYLVFDSAQAVDLFGVSQASQMAKAAIVANPNVRLSVVALPATGGAYPTAFTSVFGGDYQVFAIASNTSAALGQLRSHLEAISGPTEQRSAVGAAAFKGTVSDGTTMTTSSNSGRLSVAWLKASASATHELAAAYAAVIAGEEDPARPLNTLALNGIAAPDVVGRSSRTEQEVALNNGLSPLEVGPGGKVQIVRAITTYTKNAAGTGDISLLDLTTIRSLDYIRKACVDRISLRFPREKKSKRVKAAVRSELLDVLYKLEELEITENVEENKALLLVEDNLQDPNRLDVVVPADVVNGLHVFASRIDLYL